MKLKRRRFKNRSFVIGFVKSKILFKKFCKILNRKNYKSNEQILIKIFKKFIEIELENRLNNPCWMIAVKIKLSNIPSTKENIIGLNIFDLLARALEGLRINEFKKMLDIAKEKDLLIDGFLNNPIETMLISNKINIDEKIEMLIHLKNLNWLNCENKYLNQMQLAQFCVRSKDEKIINFFINDAMLFNENCKELIQKEILLIKEGMSSDGGLFYLMKNMSKEMLLDYISLLDSIEKRDDFFKISEKIKITSLQNKIVKKI